MQTRASRSGCPTLKRASRAALLFALVAMMAGCAVSQEEPQGSTSSRISSAIGSVKVTHYTLARESDFQSESDFLCSGRGVAMQGTGIRNDGTYVKYISGGGGWCGGYARLCNCASAKFSTVDSVFGASGRSLIKNYSIAVDPTRIPLGSYVWLDALGHWFRADDTGGAIVGMHIDVYTAEESPSLAGSAQAFITSEPHEAGDPGPNGEAASGAPTKENEEPAPVDAEPTPRPIHGPFEALDVRYPVGAGGYVTQCSENGDEESVWMTMSSGKDTSSRWAEAKYPQLRSGSCGEAIEGIHPIVFRSEPAGTLGATWITQCAPDAGLARVFKVDGEIDNHPMAPFHHNEIDASCAR